MIETKPSATVLHQRFATLWPLLLIGSVIFLLPFARYAAVPVLAMVVLGLYWGWGHRAELWSRPGGRLLLALWACYWLPALLSGLDAVAPAKTWQTIVATMRFVPMAAFVLWAMRDTKHQRWLLRGLAWLIALWALDALVQAVIGYNALGMPRSEERLNGVFGDNIKLAHVLAVLAPLLLEYTRRHAHRAVLVLAYLLLLVVIALAGTRSAWVMFAVVSLAYVYFYARRRPWRWLKAMLVLPLAAAAIMATGYYSLPSMAKKVDQTLTVFRLDRSSVDVALGFRLPIWDTAVAMSTANPINGVGVRGFRYAYPDYAASDDPWVRTDTQSGAHHAHQLLLEVTTETGLIGLLGLLFAVVLAWRHWRRLPPSSKDRALPYALALLAMLFPINTHLAFYSTFWSLLCWWLVMMYCACDER